jgi:hypothetical protein
MGRTVVSEEMHLKERAFSLWFQVLRYIVPVGIVLVFCHVLWDFWSKQS